MSKEDIKPKKVKIRSNLDVVGPELDNFGNYPIFSQPVFEFKIRNSE
jgi:hypothetical protein